MAAKGLAHLLLQHLDLVVERGDYFGQRGQAHLVEQMDHIADGVLIGGDQPGDRACRRPRRRRHDDHRPPHPDRPVLTTTRSRHHKIECASTPCRLSADPVNVSGHRTRAPLNHSLVWPGWYVQAACARRVSGHDGQLAEHALMTPSPKSSAAAAGTSTEVQQPYRSQATSADCHRLNDVR